MAAETLPATLLLIGVSVLAGFLGHALFKRHRVSDILLLLFVGFAIGPLLGLVDASILRGAMPILGPIGLALVLFEGGLELRWDDLRRHGASAVGFTLLGWTLTVGALTVTTHLALGLPWHLALLLSAAVGATGIVAVIPMLAQVRAPPKARVWLTVETGLGDLLSAVVVTSLSTLYVFGGGPTVLGATLAARFALGAAVGVLAGLAWARVLFHVKEKTHAYALTLGALLVTYAITELLQGSGYLGALVFGLVVGNAPALMREGGVPALDSLSQRGREHQGEIIFLLRSVYFVYLGLSLSRDMLDARHALAIAAFGGAMLVARLVTVFATHRAKDAESTRAHLLLVSMMPRAMAAAVLASLPLAAGVPGTERFVADALLVIVAADICTTIGMWLYGRRHPIGAPEPAPARA